MADIKFNPSQGYVVISEEIDKLFNDIEQMRKDGSISDDDAEYLFKRFGMIARTCSEYKGLLYNEEVNENKNELHF